MGLLPFALFSVIRLMNDASSFALVFQTFIFHATAHPTAAWQYEGTTLLPIVKKMEKRFSLSHPMIVTDARLLCAKNIEHLEEEGYEYIIGAGIRSMPKAD